MSRKCNKTVYQTFAVTRIEECTLQDTIPSKMQVVVQEIQDRIPVAIFSKIPKFDVDGLEYSDGDAIEIHRQRRLSADAKIFKGL